MIVVDLSPSSEHTTERRLHAIHLLGLSLSKST